MGVLHLLSIKNIFYDKMDLNSWLVGFTSAVYGPLILIRSMRNYRTKMQ